MGVPGCLLLGILFFGGPEVTHRVAPVLVTSELQAQVPEDAARARYQRAREDFLALQREGQELEPRVTQAARTLQNYREAGNQRALSDVFLNEFVGLSNRLDNVNVRSSTAKSALDEARRELLRVLRSRETNLLAELERVPAPSRARQNQLNQLIVDIRREVNQLEREREPIAEVGFRPVPDLRAAPTDGPTELRLKAEFLEGIAQGYVFVISLVDEEIRVREQSALLQRNARDSRAAITRFDGDRPPGTGAGVRTPSGQAADGRAGDARTDEPAFVELPLVEQIERLRSVRMQAEDARDLALSRSGNLRTQALERGGPR
ncbi:MAG: hypothetical protein EA350_13660 [Gemmatimonadales bacterium]|nr:MAG: hypothetical protein EA350_13660 [Gemmatimonadales bacterium]